jgi:hypothetical protein
MRGEEALVSTNGQAECAQMVMGLQYRMGMRNYVPYL